MRVRRAVLVATLLAAPLSVLVSSPADAAPPNTGCAVGWYLVPTFIAPVFALADNVNHDGLVCTRNLPNEKGGLLHDNTSAATDGWG